MRRLVLVACIGLLFIRLSLAQDAKLPDTPKPGRYTLTITSGGFDRVAHIHIPKTYKVGAKPPLVLVLHGAGGNGEVALDKDRWASKADNDGFISVAPDGLPALPRLDAKFLTNPRLWNSGQLKPRSPRAAIDDVAFIKQLLDELKEKMPYDESRVFCTGHSNGGGMTFRLGAELSERFTAIGTVAGMMALENPQPKKRLPTLYILGTKDPLMPMDGGEVKLPWGARTNPPVSEPLAAWAKALKCETEPRTIFDKNGVKKLEYPSKAKGPPLTVIFIEGHGHHWPGGQRTLPETMIGPITNKLDATDTLWEFFKGCASAK